MVMVDTDYWCLYRRACGSSQLAWSKGRWPPGAVSVFIVWIEWTTSCQQRPLSWACRHAEFWPWLSGWRSASRVRSQVWCGRPRRRLQSLGR